MRRTSRDALGWLLLIAFLAAAAGTSGYFGAAAEGGEAEPSYGFLDGSSVTAPPYPDCSAARAAGAAPVHEGQPGFAPWLDRDGDRIGCEPWRGR